MDDYSVVVFMLSKSGSFFEPYNPFMIFFDLMFRVKIIIKIMQKF